MNEELLQFTRQALAHNIPRPQIAETLNHAGWGASDIHSALGSFADLAFPVPVPRPKPYLSAREVFIYLVMFCSLYDVCWNTGSLIFDLINKAFPDPSQNNYSYWNFYSREAMRWSVSNLSVTFPLFLYTFHLIQKSLAENPVRRGSRVRKWLTYLTMLFATLSLTCDVGTLVYNLLGGELTTRFLLKALTVAFIAGGTFLYFLQDMRREEKA